MTATGHAVGVPPFRARFVYFCCILFILGLDQATKQWALQALTPMSESSPYYPYGGIALFENFFGVEGSLSLTFNTGAAWGILRDQPQLLTAIRLTIMSGLFVWFWFLRRRELLLPFTMILGGAFGNLLDLVLQGKVVDMIHFRFWGYDYPIFNVADCFICIGIFCWVALSWFEEKRAS